MKISKRPFQLREVNKKQQQQQTAGAQSCDEYHSCLILLMISLSLGTSLSWYTSFKLYKCKRWFLSVCLCLLSRLLPERKRVGRGSLSVAVLPLTHMCTRQSILCFLTPLLSPHPHSFITSALANCEIARLRHHYFVPLTRE